jgi:two-component system chemotaxis response regulator CheB
LTPVVVALVCSAGGLEALRRVLAPLPPDFPGAIVVLQHQSPDYDSRLPDLLAVSCRLPVASATDGAALKGGTVVVVPSGRHALVTVEHTIALIVSGDAPPYRPSADLLLTSLALTVGRRSIAVILSGSGTDGATGATAVHDFGGFVIAADRASSAHFGMPAAAIGRGDDVVDLVLPVDDIAACLARLVEGDAA